jgi:hypothetical protein
VRLLDVDAALSARSYATPIDLVLEVDDPFCDVELGRHRLRDGAASQRTTPPTSRSAPEALGAIYLGGTPLTALAAPPAPRARELRRARSRGRERRFRGAVRAVVPGDLLRASRPAGLGNCGTG